MVTGATKDTAIDCFTVSKENAIIHNSLSNKAGRLYNEHKAIAIVITSADDFLCIHNS